MITFKVYSRLYGEAKSYDSIDMYIMERGCIINDCYAYFEGRPYQNKSEKPCGVIQIIDEDIQK